MNKILYIILIFLLSSCGMTQKEMEQKIKDCKKLGLGYHYDNYYGDSITCNNYIRLKDE